jgi:BASS family bile acid:Na+ symporter
MNQGLRRNFQLMGAMLAGLLFPAAHEFQFLIRYFIMAMLFLSFLELRPVSFTRHHAWLLGASWVVGGLAWAVLRPWNAEIALTALLIGLTPTATAAPVITQMLGGRTEFVVSSVLLSNLAAGLVYPLVIPWVMGPSLGVPVGAIFPFLVQTLGVVLLPFVLAQAVRLGAPALKEKLLRLRHVSFYLWLATLFLATANAGFFIQHSWHDTGIHLRIVLVSLLAAGLCTVNFWVGRRIGGKAWALEASQSLGQKNTMLSIWFALTFINPLVALGPIFYILCHNSYNAWQLSRLKSPPESLPER